LPADNKRFGEIGG